MATVSIEDNLFERIIKIAKKENTTENEIINEIIEEGIKNRAKNKIPAYLIGNKETYNPDPDSFKKMAGIVKDCKPFNAVELVREMRNGEL